MAEPGTRSHLFIDFDLSQNPSSVSQSPSQHIASRKALLYGKSFMKGERALLGREGLDEGLDVCSSPASPGTVSTSRASPRGWCARLCLGRFIVAVLSALGASLRIHGYVSGHRPLCCFAVRVPPFPVADVTGGEPGHQQRCAKVGRSRSG